MAMAWTPNTHGKMKGFKPPNIYGLISPKNEGNVGFFMVDDDAFRCI